MLNFQKSVQETPCSQELDRRTDGWIIHRIMMCWGDFCQWAKQSEKKENTSSNKQQVQAEAKEVALLESKKCRELETNKAPNTQTIWQTNSVGNKPESWRGWLASWSQKSKGTQRIRWEIRVNEMFERKKKGEKAVRHWDRSCFVHFNHLQKRRILLFIKQINANLFSNSINADL